MRIAHHLETLQVHAYSIHAQVPTPGPVNAPPALMAKTSILLGFGVFLVLTCAVGGLLYAAGTMAASLRSGQGMGEHGSRLVMIMAACVIAGSASAIVGFAYL